MAIDLAQANHYTSNIFSLAHKKISLHGSDSSIKKVTKEVISRMDALLYECDSPIEEELDGMVFFAENSIRNFLHNTHVNKYEIIDFLKIRIIDPFLEIQDTINKNQLKEGSAIILEKICVDPNIAKENLGYFNIEDGINSLINNMALNLAKKKIRINTISTKLNPNDNECEDFGYSAVYLLSNASRWVTGSNIILTGYPTR